MKLRIGFALILMTLSASVAAAQSAEPPVQSGDAALAVEVFQVLEFPVSIVNPVLVKTRGGYLLRCSLSNLSEFRQLGLRYSLAVLNPNTPADRRILSRNEGLGLAPYQNKTVTFKIPLKLKLDGDERVVLMLDQLITTDYLWNVTNSKEALAAYLNGDYSITPRVLRVKNQVDAPLRPRVIY